MSSVNRRTLRSSFRAVADDGRAFVVEVDEQQVQPLLLSGAAQPWQTVGVSMRCCGTPINALDDGTLQLLTQPPILLRRLS